jgi:formylglycine-generating enzyme required for sulfatase activity
VPTGGVALVYYVGLGAHVERLGKVYNLLRPVGTSIGNDGDYRSRGLNVADLVKLLREKSGARVGLVFLDACWQSPIKPETERVMGGLRAFDVAPGVTVMFAAGSEQTVPVPQRDAASAFARVLTRQLGQLDDSMQQTCRAIAAESGKAWFDGAPEEGLGPRSTFPVAETLREGTTPGEGFVNSVGMTFRWCPPGNFTMGSQRTETSATRDRKSVPVTLTSGFWMSEHEVTQREYYAVMRKTVSPGFTTHGNAPFWGITEAKQVIDFCTKLNDIERKAGTLPDGWQYGCPTEAEWEYACRAGSTAAFCYGESTTQLGFYGNFADKTLWTTSPDYHWAHRAVDDGVAEALAIVGSYRPNAWGLRDMHGNVAEVVADHLTPELPGGTDPLARVEKDGRTQIRGGAWCSVPLYCESSFRNAVPGRDKLNFIGFRVALKRGK